LTPKLLDKLGNTVLQAAAVLFGWSTATRRGMGRRDGSDCERNDRYPIFWAGRKCGRERPSSSATPAL